MLDSKERCESCGKRTELGVEQDRKRSKQNPIFGTDFSKPLSDIIEDVRNRLTAARGTLSDIDSATGWGSRTKDVGSLLTCGIHVLYDVAKEIREFEKRQL